MTVGSLIAKKRKEKRLSQRALAAMLRLSPGAIAQWELDQTHPGPTNRSMLAVVLDIEPDALKPGGSPEEGEFVKNPDELALLGFFRTLDGPDRDSFINVLFMARRQGHDAA